MFLVTSRLIPVGHVYKRLHNRQAVLFIVEIIQQLLMGEYHTRVDDIASQQGPAYPYLLIEFLPSLLAGFVPGLA